MTTKRDAANLLTKNTKQAREIARRRRFEKILREGKRVLKLPANERAMVIELCNAMKRESDRMALDAAKEEK